MLTEFSISGFRCFDSFTAAGLSPITLISGKNNVGKTAFLEALFVFSAPQNAGLTVGLNASRGIEALRAEPEDMWGWLFNRGAPTRSLRLEGVRAGHGVGRKSALQISLRPPLQNIQLRKPKRDEKGTGTNGRSESGAGVVSSNQQVGENRSDPDQLEMVYSLGRAKGRRVVVEARETGLVAVEGDFTPVQEQQICMMISTRQASMHDSIENFSSAVLQGRSESLVDALRHVEPRLLSISLLMHSGAPALFGDIGIGVPIPLSFMGEGVSRLVRILLAISRVRDGLLLIDEVETGLHYSILPVFWKTIGAAAAASNVQVIATTHSRECIDAAVVALADADPTRLSLLRFDRGRDGAIESVHYSESELEEAHARGLEIR